MKFLWIILLTVGIAGLYQPAAHAQQFNQRLTIYAAVSHQRGIYVNSSGLITKIAGNTSNNVRPTVFNENNQVITMTDSVQNQYQKFLKAHDYHLNAGQAYYLNPKSQVSLTII